MTEEDEKIQKYFDFILEKSLKNLNITEKVNEKIELLFIYLDELKTRSENHVRLLVNDKNSKIINIEIKKLMKKYSFEDFELIERKEKIEKIKKIINEK
jgi:hypothetical protein